MTIGTAVRVAVVVAVAVVAGVAGHAIGDRERQTPYPEEGSVDVGFARDMSIHHAGAVELAELVRGRSDDDAIRRLAADIALTQQAQIGQMRGWLDVWGLPPTRTGPVMAWMGDPVPASEMPGLATRDEVAELSATSGVDAERRFLELMIDHHRAGVAMADAAVTDATEPEVRALARAVASSQSAEISSLIDLLEARGGQAPVAPTSPHENDGDHG